MNENEKTLGVFLRGINVNGRTIKMETLQEAFASMGFQEAKTLLATGNVILPNVKKSSGTPHDLKTFIEKQLSQAFKDELFVFIRSRDAIEDICHQSKALSLSPDVHLYYLFCDNAKMLMELEASFKETAHGPEEQLHIHEGGAFWIVGKGMTLKSPFGSKVLGSKRYKSFVTSRNVNTLEKMSDKMAQLTIG